MIDRTWRCVQGKVPLGFTKDELDGRATPFLEFAPECLG